MNNNGSEKKHFDVITVGAGMAGLYMLHKLRTQNFTAIALETGDDVGGTWYWNRYPGARCDIESLDYSYSFDPELEKEWQWSERYATQPEILRYLQFVADRYDLRRDIRFSTKVERAEWDESTSKWHVTTANGESLTCQYYVMATGCLSLPKEPDVKGVERFSGQTYFTNCWPHERVDFTGMRVAVIGTGSSGIQSIPLIAQEASQLTVFQRTANYAAPANNGPVRPEHREKLNADREAYREEGRWSRAGVPLPTSEEPYSTVDSEERQRRLEVGFAQGDLLTISSSFSDLVTNAEANESVQDFFRDKVRAKVTDPQIAEDLCAKDFPLFTKRLCLETNYFKTFNLPHTKLVNLRRTPIDSITETGIDTTDESMKFDAIVFATGFDAMTGAIVAVDIRGRDGIALKDVWGEGPKTYLGLNVHGFPNFFTITGPGSPSVLSNMVVSIEQHVNWLTAAFEHLREEGFETIEATAAAQDGWVTHVNDFANLTLYPSANSWYMGANVPGKPRVFLPYIGGVDTYRQACNEVVEKDYLGFEQSGTSGGRCNESVIRFVKPDVQMVLDAIAGLEQSPLNTLSPVQAREQIEANTANRAPGPEVGEIIDGTLPGPAGLLNYRLYRPPTAGPHPIVVYYHGGGWVLGHASSDDPFCRYLCAQSNALIISVNYRHAPENRFPAAVEDAFGALNWIADNAKALGGIPNKLSVAGWSAGGNLATVMCQLAQGQGGPNINGQLLVCPVTDCDFSTASYNENAEGYILTRNLMEWFWNQYCEAEDRKDPRASPLRAESLVDLPPAIVVTAELDPLRDEGNAYAAALQDAGVIVQHIQTPGQIHTSLTAVGMVASANDVRQAMSDALRAFAK
ncbi:MAG: alpha/beta hydrolase fold domain-containing protein [Gammaproteobacteria bacterium]|nr:alpha/beta hydrolase fold domain-containing protein [Gammaproteobacteria bacterium]